MHESGQQDPATFMHLKEFQSTLPDARPLAQLLEHAAKEFEGLEYVSFKDRSFSYAESWALVRAIASGLKSSKIMQGDRVGICLSNTPHYSLACFALWRIGAAGVGMNPLYSLRQLKMIAEDSQLQWIIVSDEEMQLSKARQVAEEVGARLIICRADAKDLIEFEPAATRGSEVAFAELCLETSDEELMPPPLDSVAMIQYTGGTTGTPKGAMLSHRNIWAGAHQILYWLHRIQDDSAIWYAAAPFSHITGLLNYIVQPTIVGGKALLTERFSAKELIDLVRKRRVSVLILIPTMLSAVLAEEKDVKEVDWSNILHVLVGGAPLSHELARRFHEATGLWPQQGYAMTETSGSGVGMPSKKLPGHEAATGIPMRGTCVEIRSLDDPAIEVLPGEDGEICFRGANVIQSYWRRPFTSDDMTPDGFFRSGDIGSLTKDGVLYLVDRLKDVIICSGYNVYPRIIEDAVLEHPSVHETVAIGIPDNYRGETVLSVITLKAGTDISQGELLDFLKSKLSPFEMPKRVEILDSLPKTENAKLSRKAIRDMFT
ncbi:MULTISPECIES: AMP-binding protein [Erythrobacteraceae]|nr:AMP-binding protein [Aurantiacibacter zhengii]